MIEYRFGSSGVGIKLEVLVVALLGSVESIVGEVAGVSHNFQGVGYDGVGG